MCLDNYIGIRGECQTATIYIDELPGINSGKAADITNNALLRPLDLVNKAFNLAQKEVLLDMFAMLEMNTQFGQQILQIIASVKRGSAGNDYILHYVLIK